MYDTLENTDIEAIVGAQETWRVTMGTPTDYSLKTEVTVTALSDVGAYWAAVSLKPDWCVERIFPEREGI